MTEHGERTERQSFILNLVRHRGQSQWGDRAIDEIMSLIDERYALRMQLREVDGLLREMHPHCHGHTHEECRQLTDFCIVAQAVARLLDDEATSVPATVHYLVDWPCGHKDPIAPGPVLLLCQTCGGLPRVISAVQ